MLNLRYILLFILVLSFLSKSVSAFELPFSIPFVMEKKMPVNLNIQDEELSKNIEDVIAKYRADAQYKDIDKQAELEQELINKTLRSLGYYGAEIEYSIEDKIISYEINPGKIYIIKKSVINSKLKDLPNVKDLDIQKGEVFNADKILIAIDSIKQHIDKNHCFFESEVKYDAMVFHPDNTAVITINVKNSKNSKFNKITWSGLKKIQQDHLEKRIKFKSGDCFKLSKLNKSKLDLFQTGLIANVTSILTRKKDKIDVEFHVTERKHRTYKAGAGIDSDKGIYLTNGWEHRNFFGRGEKLEIGLELSKLYQKLEADLTFPEFLNDKQKLTLSGDITKEELDSFDSTSASVSAILDRKINEYFTISAGPKFKLSSIEENDNKSENFALLSTPISLNYDRRDDILNPTKGFLINISLEAFVDLYDTSTSFTKSSLNSSFYHSFNRAKFKPIIALRTAIGSINGQNTDDIPADERFYAGGGGSVRGYEFQKLGVLDSGDPVGGRSFAEASIETRLRFSQDWGGVVFFDGGNSYDSRIPDIADDVRFAYGFGVRYYTDFAPMRFDIAFPLNGREDIDDAFQFYLSIGQAF